MLEGSMRPIGSLKPHPKNARTHSKKQLKQLARSIEKFGFVQAIVVDEHGTILAGHAREAAARMLGNVPFESHPLRQAMSACS